MFARPHLVSCPSLPHLISLAVSSTRMREREVVAAALSLLTHLVGTADKLGGVEAGQAHDPEQQQEAVRCGWGL